MDAIKGLLTVILWGAGGTMVLIIVGVLALMRYQASGEERGE